MISSNHIRLFWTSFAFLSLGLNISAYGQLNFTQTKNGDDFLSVGAGARSFAMGYTGVAFADDITAAYWNPAGIADIQQNQVAYMHSERFAGIVKYDYGAVALPVEPGKSAVSVSFFRQGVDDIKNTILAWDRDRGQPLADPTSYFSTFSAQDLAFILTYAQVRENGSQWGVSAKLLNSQIGSFASAWGYSIDFGIQKRTDSFSWGLHLQNATSLFKFWKVNGSAFQERGDLFDEVIPEGQNERTAPTLKSGVGYSAQFGFGRLLFAADMDIRMDGRQAYYINTGNISYEPRFGMELSIKDVVFIRGGMTNFYMKNDESLTFNPTFGAGLQLNNVSLDYSFDNFTGISSALGNTHRISVRFAFADKRSSNQ